jgi:hypothetical protein
MRPISEATARIAGKSFSRKFVALGRILTHWQDIVGEELACKAQPMELHYRKHKDQKSATLDIATSSSDATLLHYRKDLILERINQIFGERWITAIRFIHAPVNGPVKTAPKPPSPLTEGEKNHLCGMLQSIGDIDIRGKLEGLGKAVLMSTRQE